jgi:hypothetical protein
LRVIKSLIFANLLVIGVIAQTIDYNQQIRNKPIYSDAGYATLAKACSAAPSGATVNLTNTWTFTTTTSIACNLVATTGSITANGITVTLSGSFKATDYSVHLISSNSGAFVLSQTTVYADWFSGSNLAAQITNAQAAISCGIVNVASTGAVYNSTSCKPQDFAILENTTATENLGRGAPVINYGDSITYGYYASPNTLGYAYLLCTAKGWTCTNTGVSGSQMTDANMDQAIFTGAVAQNSISTIAIGTNDYRNPYCTGCSGGMSTAIMQEQWGQALASIVSWRAIPDGLTKFTAQGIPSSGGPLNAVYSGSGWGNTSGLWGGGVVKNSTQINDSVTINFFGTTGYLYMVVQAQNTSTFTLTLDTVSLGSFSLVGQLGVGGLVQASVQMPWLIRLPNLATGPHQLVLTTTSVYSGTGVTGNYFLGFAAPDGQVQRVGPYVYTSNLLNCLPSACGASQVIISQFNTKIRDVINQLASDGLHVGLVDGAGGMDVTNSSLWNNDSPYPIHPSTAGHAVLARVWEDALTSTELPNDRASSSVWKSLGLSTVNKSLFIGCQPTSFVPYPGDLGTCESATSGTVWFGSDLGSLTRNGNNWQFQVASGSQPLVNVGSLQVEGVPSSFAGLVNTVLFTNSSDIAYGDSFGADSSHYGSWDFRDDESGTSGYIDSLKDDSAGNWQTYGSITGLKGLIENGLPGSFSGLANAAAMTNSSSITYFDTFGANGSTFGSFIWRSSYASGASTANLMTLSTSGILTALGGYDAADGTAGHTGSTCTAWKNGLCTAP